MIALAVAALLPLAEMQTIRAVARDCGLDRERTALLVAIRRTENGTPPYYFGVADPRCDTYAKQCRWAANTIRRRYDGDLVAFARRWCPANWCVWYKNAHWFMHRQGVR